MIGELKDVVRALPTFIADGLDRWLLRVHQPVQVAPEQPVWCLRCSVVWPCPDAARASDRLAARHPDA